MTAFRNTSMVIVGAVSLIILQRGIANADDLILRVNNIKEPGEIHIAICDSAEAFEADRGKQGAAVTSITQGTIEMVEPGSVTYRYALPPRTYAIGIFHDANLNNRLEYCFLGVPREQHGFSNYARGFMGPPSFEDAAFSLEGKTEISISL